MRRLNNQSGSILLVFIMTLPFLILISIYYMRLSLTSYQVSQLDHFHTKTKLPADAGANYAEKKITADNSWSGTGGESTLHSDSKQRTTYQATVADVNSNLKTITI